MNIKKYSGSHPNWDLNQDRSIRKYYWLPSSKKSECRYWTRQMLKKVYGLRVNYNQVDLSDY